MKKCSKCLIEKQIESFSPTKRNEDGSVKYRSSWCSECKKGHYRSTSAVPVRRFSKLDFEKGLKECLECFNILPLSEFAKSQKGTGGVASYCSPCFKLRYYDKESSRKQSNKWRTENRSQWLAYHRVVQFNRVSTIKAVSDGTVTKEFAESIYNTEMCYWCKSYTDPKLRTMEHIIELSSGGFHSASNIEMACRSCNSSRFNKGVLNVSN